MIKLYFDGGAVPNPGLIHVAIVIGDKPYFSKLDYGTNNIAEWTALCWGLEVATAEGIKDIKVFGDSQLVVNQASGLWKIKQKNFLVFKREYDRLSKTFDNIKLSYIPRNKNLAGIYIEQMLSQRK